MRRQVPIPACPFRIGEFCGRAAVLQRLGKQGARGAAIIRAAAGAARLLELEDVRAEVSRMGDACPMTRGNLCPSVPAVPRYDENCRTLFAGHFTVLEYERLAWNQMAVLKEFKGRKWARRIDHPLGKGASKQHAAHLRDTVHWLNRKQVVPLIQFHCREFDDAITWEWALPKFR